MKLATPSGITPPAPRQDKEEPDLWQEDDIPTDDRGEAAEDEVERHPARGERDD